MSRTLTLDEAAAVLKTTADTVSDCIKRRRLPAARIGRAYVLVEEDVIQWLRGQYLPDRSGDSTNAPAPAVAGTTSKRTSAALTLALAPHPRKRRME